MKTACTNIVGRRGEMKATCCKGYYSSSNFRRTERIETLNDDCCLTHIMKHQVLQSGILSLLLLFFLSFISEPALHFGSSERLSGDIIGCYRK